MAYKPILYQKEVCLKQLIATTSQLTWKIQGEYKNTFGDIHDIQIMAGSEIRKNWVDNQASTGYGYDPKKLTFQNLIFKDETQANDWNLIHTKSHTRKTLLLLSMPMVHIH